MTATAIKIVVTASDRGWDNTTSPTRRCRFACIAAVLNSEGIDYWCAGQMARAAGTFRDQCICGPGNGATAVFARFTLKERPRLPGGQIALID